MLQNAPSGIKLSLCNHDPAKVFWSGPNLSYKNKQFKIFFSVNWLQGKGSKRNYHFQVDQYKALGLGYLEVSCNIICAMVAGKLHCSYRLHFLACADILDKNNQCHRI